MVMRRQEKTFQVFTGLEKSEDCDSDFVQGLLTDGSTYWVRSGDCAFANVTRSRRRAVERNMIALSESSEVS
jgi:hypothetical protein